MALSDPRNYTLPKDIAQAVAPTFDVETEEDDDILHYEDSLYSVDINNTQFSSDNLDSD